MITQHWTTAMTSQLHLIADRRHELTLNLGFVRNLQLTVDLQRIYRVLGIREGFPRFSCFRFGQVHFDRRVKARIPLNVVPCLVASTVGKCEEAKHVHILVFVYVLAFLLLCSCSLGRPPQQPLLPRRPLALISGCANWATAYGAPTPGAPG